MPPKRGDPKNCPQDIKDLAISQKYFIHLYSTPLPLLKTDQLKNNESNTKPTRIKPPEGIYPKSTFIGCDMILN